MLKRVFQALLAFVIVLVSISVLTVNGSQANNYNKSGYSIIDDYGRVIENKKAAEKTDKGLPIIVDIAGDSGYLAVVDDRGMLYIWSRHSDGIYNGIVGGLPAIKAVCGGEEFLAALDAEGKIHIFYDSLNDSVNKNLELIIPDDAPPFIAIHADASKLTGLTKDGQVFEYGTRASVYPADLTGVKQIACGSGVTAAITHDDNIYTAHKNYIYTSDQNSAPIPPPYYPPLMNSRPVMLAAAGHSVIALCEDGLVYGNVVNFSDSPNFIPKPDLKNIVEIKAINEHAAAIDKNGRLYIWGQCMSLGNFSGSILDVPQNLPKIKDVELSTSYVAAVGEDNKIYLWGGPYLPNIPDEINGFINNPPVYGEPDFSHISEVIDVYNYEEFRRALFYAPICKQVNIKADFSIPAGTRSGISQTQMVYIEENIILTIDSGAELWVYGYIVSDGLLKIDGKLQFVKESDGHLSGNHLISPGGWLTIYGTMNGAEDIAKYLSEDSIYNDCYIIAGQKSNWQVIIDRDISIPEGKRLLFAYPNQALVVNKGVLLNNQGIIMTSLPPIIYGTVIGNPIVNNYFQEFIY